MARPIDRPTPEEVLEVMMPNRCYVVADLVAKFEDDCDPWRGTIRNRLETLADDGAIERVTHENGTVTYRRLE